ncbi:MAG: hypothetical protein WBC73_09870 [Phormidesmis sp.]
MKTVYCLSGRLLSDRPQPSSLITQRSSLPVPLPQLVSSSRAPGESVRHVLLGSPEAVRQTIHLLHTLHYSEPILWSPVLAITEPMTITPAQGEAISLLRKHL